MDYSDNMNEQHTDITVSVRQLPALISSLPDKQSELSVDQSRAIDFLIHALSNGIPESVLEQLRNSGAAPPEILHLVRDGLLETFVKVRRILLTASENPQLSVSLESAARDALLAYFLTIRNLIREAMSLSGDVIKKLEMLSVIVTSKDLSPLSTDDLSLGIQALEDLHSSRHRIVRELTLRWADELRAQGIGGLNVNKMRSSVSGDTIVFTIPYGIKEKDSRDAVESHAKKFFQDHWPGTCKTDFQGTCNPHGGEIHANWDSGDFVIRFS